jgi:hypothetical protein
VQLTRPRWYPHTMFSLRHLLSMCLLQACERPGVAIQPLPDDSEAPPVVSDSGETEPEDVPGWDTSPPTGLCELELVCGQQIPAEPKIPCAFSVYGDDGRRWYQGTAGVETRGRSTGSYDKAQYAVELWGDEQVEVERDLLSMGPESDWVLNGAIVDRALLRNHLGFALYRAFSAERYAPESAYCSLTLDGDWRGIYFLTERPKRSQHRIDLDREAAEAGQAFIVKLDESGGAVDNSSVGHGSWTLISPRQDDASPEAIAQVSATLGAWQAALLSPQVGDPELGVLAHMDIDAAVDFVILEELMKNNDAYYLSVYLWRDPDGLIQVSPWDLDLTLGQPTYNDNTNPNSWIAYRPPWVSQLAASPAFRARLVERWVQLRGGVLSDDALLARVQGYRALMGETVYDNFEVWPIEEIDFWGYLPPRESYDEEYAYVLDWIPRRTAWMDANIAAW